MFRFIKDIDKTRSGGQFTIVFYASTFTTFSTSYKLHHKRKYIFTEPWFFTSISPRYSQGNSSLMIW
jgi:hypothetical protein